MGLLLTGLGVFGVPSINDFRDWDSYYEKRDALEAEWDKLFWESNKLHQEFKAFINLVILMILTGLLRHQRKKQP